MAGLIPEKILNKIVRHKGYLPQYYEKDIKEMSNAYRRAISKILLYGHEGESDITEVQRSQIETLEQRLEKQEIMIKRLLERLEKKPKHWVEQKVENEIDEQE